MITKFNLFIKETADVVSLGGGKEKSDKFKRWFKNSKLVDNNGNPLIVYHGTRSVFDIFKPSGKIGNQGEKDQIEGMYFTDSIDGASFFSANKNDPRYFKSVYLSIQNPYISENLNDLKNDLGLDYLGDVSDELKKQGYDGVIVKRGFYAFGGPHKKIIAFYPNQIKSATENTGKFSKLDNRINE